MALIRRKPRNSSLRFQSYVSSKDITEKNPLKSLTVGLKKSGGRNAYGRMTTRHKGGGAKRRYRIIDFRRSERDVPGRIVSIEYDPNRNVRIGLVSYVNGAKSYVLMPDGIGVGSEIMSGINVDPKAGNFLPISKIPAGFFIHNVEFQPGQGGKFARSAGASCQLMGKTETQATLKMPSGEIRMIPIGCWATVGVLGNADYKNIVWGKAGRTRHLGIRPTVRGMAMNPVDHPHGGGEGKSKSGSHPVSPWGKGAKGTKTKRKKNPLILRRKNDKFN
ncbi:50S ribosomal protein L2 [candidate division TM6 bacterium RIFCSPHIGHO2_12_FULL_32_22]|nr:MAG: 50S ribosomal protein L2 [candidate division TM6 bacterium RIFCSPHIGHO2_12_FULL_32_22]